MDHISRNYGRALTITILDLQCQLDDIIDPFKGRRHNLLKHLFLAVSSIVK